MLRIQRIESADVDPAGPGGHMNEVLEAGSGAPGFPASLRNRVPAEAAIARLLRSQSRVRPRSKVAKLFGATVLSEESRARYREVVAELAVGDALEALGADWIVLHAVPVDARQTDIDHVVIGPGGIFTLSTNYHVDQHVLVADRGFHVAGAKENHIREAEFDVGRVERRLAAAAGVPVHVVGVIVVVDPRRLTVRDVPRDIVVLTADELLPWLTSRPDILPASCIEAVTAVAEKPSTWVPGPVQLNDGPRLRQGFDDLRNEVREADRLHRLWLCSMSAALLGILGFAAWGVAMQTAGF